MRISPAFVHRGEGSIVDADINSDGAVVALIRNQGGLQAIAPHWTFKVGVEVKFPVVRWLAPDRVLVCDARCQRDARNATVFTSSGAVATSFPAGDGIQDVLVCGTHIVISYFDEGVFGNGPLSSEGLAVFNHDGQLAFGYHEYFGPQATFVADCYAIGPEDERSLWFFPYTDFPVVRLDLLERTQTKYTVPDRLRGSGGICITKDAVIFHSPYHEPEALLAWGMLDGELRDAGEHTGKLRGILRGGFIAVSDKVVSVLVPDASAA